MTRTRGTGQRRSAERRSVSVLTCHDQGVSAWIQPPGPPLLVSSAPPRVVALGAAASVEEHYTSQGGTVRRVDLTLVASGDAFFSAIAQALPLPMGFGNNWDALYDVFAEIKTDWPFPMALILHGYAELLRRNQHLGLYVAIGLEKFADGLKSDRLQLDVLYS